MAVFVNSLSLLHTCADTTRLACFTPRIVASVESAKGSHFLCSCSQHQSAQYHYVPPWLESALVSTKTFCFGA